MAIDLKTGAGATIGVGAGALGNVLSISSATMEREAIDATGLDNTSAYAKKIPAALADAGEVEVEFYYTGTIQNIAGANVTLSIVFPAIGDGSAKTLSGDAFCTSSGYPEMVNDDIMVTTATFTWSGDSASRPAFA